MKNRVGRALAAPVTIWLLVAFAAPLVVVLLLALQAGADPFAPLFSSFSGAQFKEIFSDTFYLFVLLKTTVLAMVVCCATIVLGYPGALWIVSLEPRRRPLAMSIVLVPLLVNVVVRSLGVELLLAPDGLLNFFFKSIGLPTHSHMLYTYGAIGVGLVQAFLPLMVLSLYDVLQATPPRVMEAWRKVWEHLARHEIFIRRASAVASRACALACNHRLFDGFTPLMFQQECFGRQESLDDRDAGLAGGS